MERTCIVVKQGVGQNWCLCQVVFQGSESLCTCCWPIKRHFFWVRACSGAAMVHQKFSNSCCALGDWPVLNHLDFVWVWDLSWHFLPHKARSAVFSCWKTSKSVCSSLFAEWTRMSSMQFTMNGSPRNTLSIMHWKELGAPARPKGILQNWNSPIPGPGQNAVFSLWSGWTGICQ